MDLSTVGLLVVIVTLGVAIEILLVRRLRRIFRDLTVGGEPGLGKPETRSLGKPETRSLGGAAGAVPAEVEPLVVSLASSPGGVAAPGVAAPDAAVPGLPEIVIIGAPPAKTVAPPELPAATPQPIGGPQRPSAAGSRPIPSAPLETPASSAEAGVAAGPAAGIPSDLAGQLNSTGGGSWLSLRRHTLLQGETELGELVSRSRDQPWLGCTFHPTPAFERVRPLFERELELLEAAGATFDKKAFVEQWQRIFAAGVWIRVDSTGARVRHFLLHVHADGTARLRYG